MLKDEICSWKWNRKEIIHGKWKSSVNVIIFLCLSQLKDIAIHHLHPHSTLNLLPGQKNREGTDDFFGLWGTLEGFTFVTYQDNKIMLRDSIVLKWCQLLPWSWWEISGLVHSDSGEVVSWPRGKEATQLPVLSVWSLPLGAGWAPAASLLLVVSWSRICCCSTLTPSWWLKGPWTRRQSPW